MVEVTRDEKEIEADSEDEDDFDFDAFMADDEYSDFDEFMALSDPENSDIDSEREDDSEPDSDSETSGSEDDIEAPSLLTAVPPKVLEPYHRIRKIQQAMSQTAISKGYRICRDNYNQTVRPHFAHSDKIKMLLPCVRSAEPGRWYLPCRTQWI